MDAILCVPSRRCTFRQEDVSVSTISLPTRQVCTVGVNTLSLFRLVSKPQPEATQRFHGNSGVGAAVFGACQFPFGARYGTVPTSYPGCAHRSRWVLLIHILNASDPRREPQVRGGGRLHCLYSQPSSPGQLEIWAGNDRSGCAGRWNRNSCRCGKAARMERPIFLAWWRALADDADGAHVRHIPRPMCAVHHGEQANLAGVPRNKLRMES